MLIYTNKQVIVYLFIFISIYEEGEGDNEKGEMGRRHFTDGYDEMPGWNEVTVFSDSCLPRATPGTPASIYVTVRL